MPVSGVDPDVAQPRPCVAEAVDFVVIEQRSAADDLVLGNGNERHGQSAVVPEFGQGFLRRPVGIGVAEGEDDALGDGGQQGRVECARRQDLHGCIMTAPPSKTLQSGPSDLPLVASPCDNAPMIEIAEIQTLGPCRIESPLSGRAHAEGEEPRFVSDDARVLFDDMQDVMLETIEKGLPLPGFELAGAREEIYFDPTKLRVGIVTCGGLCPGLNNVIAGLVQELRALYGVQRITGFRNGYQGFIAEYGHDTIDLGSVDVQPMRGQGGTVLGSSRGNQDPVKIVDCLERESIGVLFAIGGDGTMRGAQAIADEIRARLLKIAVVCVPKTIDNDIPVIDQSFGFQTAFAEAAHAIRAGYVEATAAPNGISLVKLMGRYSGFIASNAALADTSADVVLIPEVPFTIDGPGGLLQYLDTCLVRRGHAVVVIAEGAGQEHVDAQPTTDASGNQALGDIGGLLRRRVKEHFDALGKEITLRYIDPSYAIRTVAANAYDSVYCIQLAQAAVHAAMAGKTEVVVGRFRRRFVHLPIPLLVSRTSKVDPMGDLWWSVLENTGQPYVFD